MTVNALCKVILRPSGEAAGPGYEEREKHHSHTVVLFMRRCFEAAL